jgi:8-oxo-dGTP diphosphatase
VDLVVLTVRGQRLAALVWRRNSEPYSGYWALAGGFIRLDEALSAAAVRVLTERAGMPGPAVHLEQLKTYGYPDRDPRLRVVSVAYLGIAPDLPASTEAQMSWRAVNDVLGGAGAAGNGAPDYARGAGAPGAACAGPGVPMAFDHARILRDGVERARSKLEYTPLGAAFCPPEFTVAELRRVYEIVWGTPLDPRNFHRKVTGAENFLIPTGKTTSRDGGRPARLYRRGPADLLHPPMLRPRG